MSHFFEVTVQERQTVETVLRVQGGFTRKQISRAKFLESGILKNGVRCRVSTWADPGDRVGICLEEERSSTHLKGNRLRLDILYEDTDLLVVNKPAGVVTHPRGGHYDDTLANGVAEYFRKKGENRQVRPVGRLDRETSGAVVFAKNQVAAARFQKQRETGAFRKVYLAVAEGAMQKDGMWHRIEFPIGTDPKNRLKMRADFGGKEAYTEYQVLCGGEEYSLVRLTLKTGRTHQIRVHMKTLGYPLAGDSLYGGNTEKISRTALHAWQVSMIQPFTGKVLRIQAPIPKDFFDVFPEIKKMHEAEESIIS